MLVHLVKLQLDLVIISIKMPKKSIRSLLRKLMKVCKVWHICLRKFKMIKIQTQIICIKPR